MARTRIGARRALLLVAAAGVLYGVQWYAGVDLGPGSTPGRSPAVSLPERAQPRDAEGSHRIAVLFRDERSGVVVEAEGVVANVLRDDREGSKHQRFVVDIGGGQTVLIAHNIDLAPRAPVRRGDRVRFRGQYEWNDRGGVVHWTHHDPDGRRPGGWLEHEGHRYH